ncbi:MAG: carboxylating nicotinate-nucleotide diphosphorylase [Thermodesulfobacteriota bacterium]
MDMSIVAVIENALKEDIGTGDITTDTLVSESAEGRGYVIAKEALVLAGIDVAGQVFKCLDPEVTFTALCRDGDRVEPGTRVFEIGGRLRVLLKGERTALNFLQHLSGIATQARSWVEALRGTRVRLVDTRKTTPGLRMLEKYAVRVGGACNHRIGLFDGVLIKDNHIVACGGIAEAVRRARAGVHHLVRIEVEASTLPEVDEALAAGADVIMLDNMDLPQISEAVARINGRATVEVSGSVARDRLRELAETGVDIISAGRLTHSARAVDLSMRIESGA